MNNDTYNTYNNYNSNLPQTTHKRSHYVFNATSSQDLVLKKPKTEFTFFYQLAGCKDLETDTYQMRKFILDPDNSFSKIKNYKLTHKQYKKFFTLYKPHQYRLFSVIDLSLINYPSEFDINTANSAILTTNHDYSGSFAPF